MLNSKKIDDEIKWIKETIASNNDVTQITQKLYDRLPVTSDYNDYYDFYNFYYTVMLELFQVGKIQLIETKADLIKLINTVEKKIKLQAFL